MGSPDLLLLDEPFNGMDPETTRDLRRALVRLNRDRGVTIVISSHVLDQLMRVCTRFGVIAGGHMVREFTDEELHAACGSSVRVKTADPARALAILEERLPGATFRVEPDQAIVVGGGARTSGRRAILRRRARPRWRTCRACCTTPARWCSSSRCSSATSRTTSSSSWTAAPALRLPRPRGGRPMLDCLIDFLLELVPSLLSRRKGR